MAAQNKTEFDGAADLLFVPTLQIADHLNFLKNNLSESAVLKKDRIGSLTASSSPYVLDYTNYDYIELNCGGLAISISITGVASGQMFYAKFTNYSSIAFTGVTFIGNNPDNWRFSDGIFIRFVNKSGSIYGIIETNSIIDNVKSSINFADFANKDAHVRFFMLAKSFINAPDELMDTDILSQMGATNQFIIKSYNNVTTGASLLDIILWTNLTTGTPSSMLINWRGIFVGTNIYWVNIGQSSMWQKSFASRSATVYFKRIGSTVYLRLVGFTAGASTETLPASMRPGWNKTIYQRYSSSDITIQIATSGIVTVTGATVTLDLTYDIKHP